jgi:hypothetical protein
VGDDTCGMYIRVFEIIRTKEREKAREGMDFIVQMSPLSPLNTNNLCNPHLWRYHLVTAVHVVYAKAADSEQEVGQFICAMAKL